MSERRIDVPEDYSRRIQATPPTPEDAHYGAAFAAIGQLIDATESPELVALRLSTCRNAYLTLNAMFVSLKPAFGHGQMPSPASRMTYELERGHWQAASAALDDLGEIHSICQQKLDVWEQREQLDQQWRNALNGNGEALARDRQVVAMSVLANTATASLKGGDNLSWDKCYLEISTHFPNALQPHLEILKRAIRSLEVMNGVGQAIVSYLEHRPQAEFFTTDGAVAAPRTDSDLWLELTQEAQNRSDSLDGVRGLARAAQLTDPDVRKSFIDDLIAEMQKLQARAYSELTTFAPNQGKPPLPPVFAIDLRRQEPQRRHWPVSTLEQVSIGAASVENIVRIAIPDFGIPLKDYERDVTFTDTQVDWIESAIDRMLDVACTQGVHAMVLPEYFVPTRCADRISERATKAGLIFIGGLEGKRLAMGNGLKLQNAVRVRFPDRTYPYTQRKHYPSVLEARDFEGDHIQYVFQETRIGNFSVLICSDQMERHIVDAVAAADPAIDIMFVCGFNPDHHRLARHLAIADAMRLYCHVVLVNNSANGAAGSGVFGPAGDYDKQPSIGRHVPLDIEHEQQQLGIRILEVPIDDTRTSLTREKRGSANSSSAWLAVPNFRRPFDSRTVE